MSTAYRWVSGVQVTVSGVISNWIQAYGVAQSSHPCRQLSQPRPSRPRVSDCIIHSLCPAGVPLVQVDPVFEGKEGGADSLVKFNPLSDVSSAEVWNFLRIMVSPFSGLCFLLRFLYHQMPGLLCSPA